MAYSRLAQIARRSYFDPDEDEAQAGGQLGTATSRSHNLALDHEIDALLYHSVKLPDKTSPASAATEAGEGRKRGSSSVGEVEVAVAAQVAQSRTGTGESRGSRRTAKEGKQTVKVLQQELSPGEDKATARPVSVSSASSNNGSTTMRSPATTPERPSSSASTTRRQSQYRSDPKPTDQPGEKLQTAITIEEPAPREPVPIEQSSYAPTVRKTSRVVIEDPPEMQRPKSRASDQGGGADEAATTRSASRPGSSRRTSRLQANEQAQASGASATQRQSSPAPEAARAEAFAAEAKSPSGVTWKDTPSSAATSRSRTSSVSVDSKARSAPSSASSQLSHTERAIAAAAAKSDLAGHEILCRTDKTELESLKSTATTVGLQETFDLASLTGLEAQLQAALEADPHAPQQPTAHPYYAYEAETPQVQKAEAAAAVSPAAHR